MRPLFRTCMTLDAKYRLQRSACSLPHFVQYSARPTQLGSKSQLKMERG